MNKNETINAPKTVFEIGRTYNMKYVGDSELMTPYTVARRTAKTVWLLLRGSANVGSFRIQNGDEGEYVFPTGKYSMSPVLKSKRIA